MTAAGKIRVVFSIGALHGGGSERQIVSNLQQLDRDQFDPVLYLVYRDGPLLDRVPDDVSVTAFAERCRESSDFQLPGSMHRRRVKDMATFLKECRADVCYDRTFLMTLIAADAASKAGVPNVSTIVTDPTLGFAPVAGRFQAIKKRRLRHLYRNSSQVLAVSNGAARSAEQFYGLQPRSVETLYNGFDFDRLQTESEIAIDDQWWTKSEKSRPLVKLVTAGRLNRDKGFHLLVDAVSALKQKNPNVSFRVAILGDGEEGRTELQDQIRGCHLEEEIHLPGFRKDALSWYRTADIYVLPSLLEGMPNVLLEAMACGTPVVAADCPSGPAEILRNGEFGKLCAVNDSSDLQSAIQSLMDDPAGTCRIAEAARKHVQDRFSISTTVRRLETLLKAAAESKRERGG